MPRTWFALAVVAVSAMVCGGRLAVTPSPSPTGGPDMQGSTASYLLCGNL